jgi:hypothetical protein
VAVSCQECKSTDFKARLYSLIQKNGSQPQTLNEEFESEMILS